MPFSLSRIEQSICTTFEQTIIICTSKSAEEIIYLLIFTCTYMFVHCNTFLHFLGKVDSRMIHRTALKEKPAAGIITGVKYHRLFASLLCLLSG